MKLIILVFSLLCVNFSVAKNIDLIKADLILVDQFNCHIETKGNLVRILTSGYNLDQGRYIDLVVENFEFKPTEDGWLLSRVIDLYETSLNPIGPKWMFGNEVTEISFNKNEQELKISHSPSTMAPWTSYSFSCQGANGVVLDKSKVCPDCISSQSN